MFEGFTARARQVIELARTQAQDLHEDAVGTEHLLLGLLADEHHFAGEPGSAGPDSSSPLIDVGLDEQSTRAQVHHVRLGPRPADARAAAQIDNRLRGGELGFTERATKTLELALRASLQTSTRPQGAPRAPITPAHLLLGLLDQPDNGALRTLLAFDVDIPVLRRHASAAATTGSTPDVSAGTPSDQDQDQDQDQEQDQDQVAVAAAILPPSTPVESAIMTWLHATIYGTHLRPEYLGVLNTLASAGRDKRVPVPPEAVLISWHRELARMRTTRLQSELGFLDASARAGWTDTAIAQALAIPPDRTVVEHRAYLEAEREHHHPSQHPRPWTG